MGPKKRKTPPKDAKGQPRKKKATGKAKSDAVDEDNPVPPIETTQENPSSKSAKPSASSGKKTVQWVLPKDCGIETKRTFAPVLFGQPWEELKILSKRFLDSPHLPSPLHDENSAQRYGEEKEERIKKFKISRWLQSFHNAIWEKNEEYLGDAAGDRDGLVGYAEDSPAFLQGDQEGKLNVTRRASEKKTEKSESIKIIQRTPPGGNPELFLVLGRGPKLWVNNKEFENKSTNRDPSEMFIGPLGDFAIVELLQAPIFVWKNRKDAFSEIIADIPRAASRARDGEAGGAETSVTFTNSEDEDAGVSDPPQPGTESERGSDRGTPSDDASGPKDRRIRNKGRERPTKFPTTRTLKDARDIEELINHVIMAISDRQRESNGGFALEIDDHLVRPGQTWILPLGPFPNIVLAVIQYEVMSFLQPGNITIHVLDPGQRRTRMSIRNEIWNVVTGYDILQRWMPGIGMSLEELSEAIPKHALWVDSPVANDEEETKVITVLNAWMLAMGCSINPKWRPRKQSESRVAFFKRARELFTLVDSSQLDWEQLYKFARSERYILDEDLPRPDRQFTLRKKSCEELQSSQLESQEKLEHSLRGDRFERTPDQRNKRLEASIRRIKAVRIGFTAIKTRHDRSFPSDYGDEYETPPEDNNTPPEDNNTPPEDNNTPPEDNNTPPEDNNTPPEDNNTPPEDNNTPPKNKNTSLEDNNTPLKNNKTSLENNKTSLENNNTSLEDNNTPSENNNTPSENNNTPSENNNTPSENNNTPNTPFQASPTNPLSPSAQDVPQDCQKSSDNGKNSSAGNDTRKGSTQNHSKPSSSFDPCSFVKNRLAQLNKESDAEKAYKHAELGTSEIAASIAAVSLAVENISGSESDLECTYYDHVPGLVHPSQKRNQGVGLTLFPIRLKNAVNTFDVYGEEDRYALVVVQPSYLESNEKQEGQISRFSLHVFDHAPWLSNPELRGNAYKRLESIVRRITGLKQVKIEGNDISWIVNPPPSGPHIMQLKYYTILDGWTIALGLHMNQGFRATESLFKQARQVIRFVLSGHADWELIWSFLRCHSYVLDKEVAEKRRFRNTVARTDHRANLDRLRSDALNRPVIRSYIPYDMPAIVTHFPTDTWEFHDLHSLYQAIGILLAAGKSVAELDAAALEEAHEQEECKARPCAAFNKCFQELANANSRRMAEVKKSIDPGEIHDLLTEDVSRSLASVILAVTKKQDLYDGLNWAGMNVIDKFTQLIEKRQEMSLEELAEFATDGDPTRDRPIRFSQPIILTTNFDWHLTLMVIKYDEKQKITVTVLDSMPWRTISRQHRDYMKKLAEMVIKVWKWDDVRYREVPDGGDSWFDDIRWAPCAYQTTNHTCGYHTILNGWAAALGLRLNPRFKKHWNRDFIDQVQNVISLALLGKASSKMIHSYLACIGFVEPAQELESSRRFEHTFIGTSYELLYEQMRGLVEDDEAWWLTLEGDERLEEIRKIRHTDRVHFLDNRGYDSVWPFDRWDPRFTHFVEDLVQSVQGAIDISELDDGQLFHQLRLRSDAFRESDLYPEVRHSHIDDLLEGYKNRILREGPVPTIQEFHTLIRLDDLDRLYLEENSRRVYNIHREYLSKLLGDSPRSTIEHGVGLDGTTLFLPIAAVLQAIDKKHALQASEEDKTFAGGFALTPGDSITTGEGTLLRPRRCWLFPWQYYENSATRSHFFLVVIQEEKKASDQGSHFCMYFLDSSPRMWTTRKDARFTVFKRLKQNARNLGWTTHRNLDGQIRFCSKPRYVTVATEVGKTACGYHCIVNAWILALGMTPNIKPAKSMPTNEAHQMVQFAINGVLDSKTLIAWLFTRNLVVETEIGDETVSRMFDATVEQTDMENQTQLRDYIDESFLADDLPLAELTEADVPYVRNNVDFSREEWQFEPEETLEEEDEDVQDNGDPPALHRAVEDVDMFDYDYDDNEEDWSSFFGDLAKVAYKDRRKARQRGMGRVSKRFAAAGGTKSREYTAPSHGVARRYG